MSRTVTTTPDPGGIPPGDETRFPLMKRRKNLSPEQAAAREESLQVRMAASRRDLAAMRQRVLNEVLADIERKYSKRKDD